MTLGTIQRNGTQIATHIVKEMESGMDRPIDDDTIIAAGPGGGINQVSEGMRVLDASGEELGKVEHVRMGDPGAVTTGARMPRQGGIIRDIAEGLGGEGEPRVPEPLRSRFLRSGYVKIDGKGWIDTDRYVAAEHIAGVTGDTVTLTLLKDQILAEDAK
jgi:hypothetical protein